jgi:hypothetical protein
VTASPPDPKRAGGTELDEVIGETNRLRSVAGSPVPPPHM